jgi:hypothetical protein
MMNMFKYMQLFIKLSLINGYEAQLNSSTTDERSVATNAEQRNPDH